MIIPNGKFFSKVIEDAWETAAVQFGIERGIMVEVGKEYEAFIRHSVNTFKLTRIFFQLNGHEFETLTDLKRAIELKAFL